MNPRDPWLEALASTGLRKRAVILRIAIAILALVPLAVGLRWLQLFIFTDYRAHLRPVLIPMGVAAVIVGLGMIWWSLLASGRRGRRAR